MMGNNVEWYELQRVMTTRSESSFATAAIRSCGLCGNMIDGMGGPGYGSICIPCGDALRKGKLRGAVKWDDPNPAAGSSRQPPGDDGAVEERR